MGIWYQSEENKIRQITLGPHILVTNKSNINYLIAYIEGKIDGAPLSLDSGVLNEVESNNLTIYFKYREISVSQVVHKSASNINYLNKLNSGKIDFKKSHELIKISNNKNLIKYLNVIPLTSDIINLETIDNDYSIYNIKGILHKYTDNIEIFIYNKTNNSYEGIVYKNKVEYLRFKDTTIENNNQYNLIRQIENNFIYVKDNEIQFMETMRKSKVITQKKRDLIKDKNYLTFDIECYIEKDLDKTVNKNNENIFKFTPYSSEWYCNNKNKNYIVTNYSG
jgi:hypothetical protein